MLDRSGTVLWVEIRECRFFGGYTHNKSMLVQKLVCFLLGQAYPSTRMISCYPPY